MKDSILLWKEIITNPFQGYGKLDNNTKVGFPLLVIILLLVVSSLMTMPILTSDSYAEASVRMQTAIMADRGTEWSQEQQDAMLDQMKSPMVRNITVVSALFGGVFVFFLITVILSLILKGISSSAKKETVKFSLIFKIFIFASIVAMVQSILKVGISLTGDWMRALARVNDAMSLQAVMQTPLSLAALMDPAQTNPQLYLLVDSCTDIFNWIYYIFIYAGLKYSVKLEKKQAISLTVAIAVIGIAIGLAFSLLAS